MIRAARQRARRLLAGLQSRLLGGSASAAYRPDLSEESQLERLATWLMDDDNASRRETGNQAPMLRDVRVQALALAARNRIGRRFFVDPGEIPELWRRLGEEYPVHKCELLDRAQHDRREGIPLYARRGPSLGPGFHWLGLPLGPGNDDLYPKRPHRFAFAPRQALAGLDDPEAVAALGSTLQAWVEHAAHGHDKLFYGGSLRVIQRVLALSWCWAFLAARPATPEPLGLPLELLVLRIILADVQFLAPRLGHSVPNNHLLADYFAGWYLQKVFPEFLGPATSDWHQLWCRELLRQTYPDGGSFEHSAHYHEFACEMGAAYLLLCRRNCDEADAEVSRRVGALLRFQCSLTGPEAVPVPFGNGIEDTLFPLDPGEGWCAGSLRELYRALVDPELEPAPTEDPGMQRAFWLLAGKLAPSTRTVAPTTASTAFPQSGFHVYDDRELGSRAIFRTGPMEGMSLTAGHMHADLLSVYLSQSGRPVLVDAGTFTYRRAADAGADNLRWRPYLAGPQAHNTLAIRGHDPLGASNGDFRPSATTARVHGEFASTAALAWAEARLTGAGPYSGYTRGCIHVPGHYWLVYDIAPPSVDGEPDAERWYGFQFAPGTNVIMRDNTATARQRFSDSTLSIVGSLRVEPELLIGSTSPLGGWVSPRYGEILPAPQLRFALGRGIAVSAFALVPATSPTRALRIGIEAAGGGIAIRLETHSGEDRVLVHSGPRAEPAHPADLTFAGRLLWVRTVAGHPREARWLDGHRLEWPDHALSLDLSLDSASSKLFG